MFLWKENAPELTSRKATMFFKDSVGILVFHISSTVV